MTSFKSLLLALALVLPLSAAAQRKAPEYVYTEAAQLTLVGKVFPDTGNPYQRIDTARFHGFTKEEVRLVQESAGIAVAFRTNSTPSGCGPSTERLISAEGPRVSQEEASIFILKRMGNGSGLQQACRTTTPWTNR